MTPEYLERLVRVESRLTLQDLHNDRIEKVQRDTASRVEDVNSKLDDILLGLERNKGFIGGVLFVTSAIWLFLKAGLPYIMKLLGKEYN